VRFGCREPLILLTVVIGVGVLLFWNSPESNFLKPNRGCPDNTIPAISGGAVRRGAAPCWTPIPIPSRTSPYSDYPPGKIESFTGLVKRNPGIPPGRPYPYNLWMDPPLENCAAFINFGLPDPQPEIGEEGVTATVTGTLRFRVGGSECTIDPAVIELRQP
jgi:hypothetical protein